MGQLVETDRAGRKTGLRPAVASDIPWVHQHLRQAIDASPFYGEAFKAHERRRYSASFLRSLISIDPWHVAIAESEGVKAGFVITMPEYGTLWSPWIYVLPEFRRTTISLTIVRESVAHWDNGRFHKSLCYAKPDNEAARTLFRRYGFHEVAILKHHILGEDLVLLERHLNKVVAGYDQGVNVGRLGRLRLKIRDLLHLGSFAGKDRRTPSVPVT